MKPYKIYCSDGKNIVLIKAEASMEAAEKYVEYLKVLPEYAGKNLYIVV